jgi:hypothetical protein
MWLVVRLAVGSLPTLFDPWCRMERGLWKNLELMFLFGYTNRYTERLMGYNKTTLHSPTLPLKIGDIYLSSSSCYILTHPLLVLNL